MTNSFPLTQSFSIRILTGLILFVGLTFSACTPKDTAADSSDTDSKDSSKLTKIVDHPKLTMDEAHNALWQDSAQVYLTRPNSEMILKQADYAFHIPSDMNRPDVLEKFGVTRAVTGPNIVHVLYNDNLYKTPWTPTNGEVALRATSLGGGQSNRPFERFEAGNTVFIFIGFEGSAAEPGAESPFAPFYALRILVDENPLRFVKQPGKPLPIKKDPTVSTKP